MHRIFVFFLLGFFSVHYVLAQDVAQYVNPFIGTAVQNEGRTYPGAVLPWGAVSVSPYYIKFPEGKNSKAQIGRTEKISGFGHVHLSGVGCNDFFGSIFLMPATGPLRFREEELESAYSNEKADAGFYTTMLDRFGIKAEMTATTRSGISRYSFPAGTSNIILDLSRKASGKRGSGFVHQVSQTEWEGYKREGQFCGESGEHNIYFVLKLSKKPASSGVWNNYQKLANKNETGGENVGAFFQFTTKQNETIEVRVGISYVSIANARENLAAEQRAKSFEQIKANAYQRWNKELSRIQVTGGSAEEKTIFYTGIYHMLLHPNVFNDVNGEYPQMGSRKIAKAEGYTRYTVFSLWDTYRNVHPFLTLVYPGQQLDMVKSMIAISNENGWLPKWEQVSHEANLMNGDPSIPVLADTYIKGLTGFDIVKAYEAARRTSITHVPNPLRPAIKEYNQYGYIPNDLKLVWGSVSTSLEYNYADWCLAQLAKVLGREEDYQLLSQRSLFYKKLFDSSTHFIRPRLSNGSFMQPFDPVTANGELEWNYSGGPGFTEGSAWQYTFFVPHDIAGLQQLMGGPNAFAQKLQTCFDSSYFVLMNEPDMSYPYLFNYVPGQSWRTQKLTRKLIRKHFSNSYTGLPGNDDGGALSAWLVFSMMGFYPDCPGTVNYQITTPVFDKIVIKLDQRFYKGKTFQISTKNNQGNNLFIQSAILNNKKIERNYLKHQDIVNGGKIEFSLSDAPKLENNDNLTVK